MRIKQGLAELNDNSPDQILLTDRILCADPFPG
jgi:hypothetical protein